MNPTNVSNTAPFSEETILPFRIQIPESDLLDLKERLTALAGLMTWRIITGNMARRCLT